MRGYTVHVLIALITAVAGLLWALHSLHNAGVSLGGLNPFSWARRRQWDKKYNAKPLHRLDNPMDVAAVLIVGIVKMEGDISREQKSAVIALFENEFRISFDQAGEMFGSCVYLLRDCLDVAAEVKNIIAPARERFDAEKIDSMVSMMKSAATLEGKISAGQTQLIEQVTALFSAPADAARGTWG